MPRTVDLCVSARKKRVEKRNKKFQNKRRILMLDFESESTTVLLKDNKQRKIISHLVALRYKCQTTIHPSPTNQPTLLPILIPTHFFLISGKKLMLKNIKIVC